MMHSMAVALCCALIQASATVHGTVRAEDSGQPIAYAAVEISELGRRTAADSAGTYTLADVPAGRFELRASAPGYASRSVTFESSGSGRVRVDLALDPEPIRLRPLTTRAERRRQAGGAAERALFAREVSPGVVGLSGRELREVPVLAESDVLRSLNALPDVAPLNDLSAQPHVQGGAPDQNLYLLDGARVFAPYHLFGLFGAFNSDAVGRVDLFRGHLPARYGGALSSVINVAPPTAIDDPLQLKGGFSLLAARATARGRARDGDAQWLLAARRTHADLFLDGLFAGPIPYGFFDVQVRGALRLAPGEEVSASGFVSSDRFDMFLDAETGSLDSRWQNAVGSVRWSRSEGSRELSVGLSASHYGASLRVGQADRSPVTRNHILVGGLSADLTRRGGALGYRLGVDVDGGVVALDGSDRRGGYVTGDVRSGYLLTGAYGELETWLGPLRLTPGLRLAGEAAGGRVFVEPRLSGRIEVLDGLSVTAGLARTHQILSTLRDDRYPVPGAPMWVLHPERAPASRADGASLSLEGWAGRTWSLHLTGYLRRFRDVARWRPAGTRTVDRLAFDDGGARGASLMVRRHEGWLRGWVGYTRAHVRLTEAGSGRAYDAAWDRRHTVDAALFLQPFDALTASARVSYGTGRPFWPQIGEIDGERFDPLQGRITESSEEYPVFAPEQLRFPDRFRLDAGLRGRIQIGPVRLEPYLSVLNATLRYNVLYYRLSPEPGPHNTQEQVSDEPVLEPEHVLPFFPSVGLDVRF